MSKPRARVVRAALVSSLVVFAACSSTSSRSVTSDSTTLAASSPADVSTTSAGSATGTETTTAGGATATAPPTAPPTTKPTTPSAPPTTKPTTPATTPPTSAPSTAPPTTAAGPKITNFSFSDPAVCAAPDVSFVTTPPSVRISWTATGADSVYVAIDNQDGPYYSNLPLQGSTDLNFSCPGPHTYWVVAVKGNQKDYKSKSYP